MNLLQLESRIKQSSYENVFFRPRIDKTCVRDVLSERSLNMDIRSMQAIWHVPSVSV